MKKIIILPIVVALFLAEPTLAAGKRVKSIDGGSDSSADTPAFGQSPGTSSGAALSLARSASEGAGRLKEDGALCYRAVKQIVADAFGKDLNCVRGILSNGSAKNAGNDLLRFGFVLDNSRCNEPGTVRVYRGRAAKGYRALEGDTHGHVEVVGDEGMYHSFYRSSMSIDESMPGRRILTGCYVADTAKFQNGPGAKCPPAKKSLKTRPFGTPKNKSKSKSGVD